MSPTPHRSGTRRGALLCAGTDAPRPPAAAGEPLPEDAGEIDRLRTEIAQLRRALESHPVIDQARGMVMVLGPCTVAGAWEVLVEVSQRTNVKLRAVAEHLVATTGGRTLPPPLRHALDEALRARRAGRRRPPD
jgi:hypothetical protein